MAARASVVRIPARTSPTTIKVSAPRAVAPAKKKGRRRSSSGAATTSNKRLMGVAVGSMVFGWVEKSDFGQKLPTLAPLGRKGSLALASYFLARQLKSPLAWDVCTAAVALSAYEFAKDGKISGDDVMGSGYDDEDVEGYDDEDDEG